MSMILNNPVLVYLAENNLVFGLSEGFYVGAVAMAYYFQLVYPTPPLKKSAGMVLFIRLHNLFLVALSAYMSFGMLFEARKYDYPLWGALVNPEHTNVTRYLYLFYVSKLYEFIDTFIMIATGNFRQVSFLHVYHHGTVAIFGVAICRLAPGGHAWLTVVMNSFVHMVMYFYYFISTFTKNKKYLFWGKYLTQLQMTQFVILTGSNLMALTSGSKYPRILMAPYLLYILSMLGLFVIFYSKKWTPAKKEIEKKEIEKKEE